MLTVFTVLGYGIAADEEGSELGWIAFAPVTNRVTKAGHTPSPESKDRATQLVGRSADRRHLQE
jgi:hypothetical protein